MTTMLDATSWARTCDVDTPYIKVVGAGGTGKTLGIVSRAKYLLENGIPASNIILLCSTCAAADRLNRLLANQFQNGTADGELPQVKTIQHFEMEVLAHDDVRELTGRNPRILADFEERILMEDMKVCGLKPKRLREMLKFFYRELTELNDEKDTFICDSEESEIYSSLTENLRFLNAMLPQELSNVACKFARDNSDIADKYKKDFTLVDDFQNLNKASQLFVELMTKRSLVITGCLNEQVETLEPYPYPQGFATFEENHNTEVIRLGASLRCPERIVSMSNSLVCEGGLEISELASGAAETPGDVQFVKWTYPNDEFLGIARYIKHRLNNKEHLISECDIFVAVPNVVWGRAIAKVLQANNIHADLITSHHALRGDPRELKKCSDMQAYTRLNLVAHEDDVVAWRCWCGYGDYLTNSNKWFHLEKYAQEANIGILDALDLAECLIEDELFPGASDLVERYRAGKKFIEHAKGKTGFALLNDCAPVRGEEPPKGFMDLLEPVDGGESALELFERAQSRLETRFKPTNAVRIGLMEMSCGLSFDTVIFAGAIEGFYPAIKTIGVELDDDLIQDIRKQERREWYAAMSKTEHTFVVSTVQKDESSAAAALGMYAHRIRMEDGKSMAILAPTPYIDEMGDEAPGFLQTLMD